MKLTRTHFRLLLLLSFCLPVIGGLYDSFVTNTILEQSSDFILSLEPESSDTEDILLTAWLAFIVLSALISMIGLWLFKSWARGLYIITYIASIPLTLLSGISVYSSAGQVFNDLSFLLSGIIIALMYYSSLSKEFKKRSHSKSIGIV